MRLDRTRSHGPGPIVSLAAAMVDYVQHSEAKSDLKAKRLTLWRFFGAIWPGMTCHIGDTHYRVIPFGADTSTSFYVDMTEAKQARWSPELDSSNQFGIGATGENDWLKITRPVMGIIKRDEAINLAAWLFVLADPTGQKFYRLADEIVASEHR